MIIVVSPNTGVDITYELMRFDANRVNRARAQVSMIGGKPVNVVRTLARLGIPSKVFTFCDSGSLPFLKKELGKLGAYFHITPISKPLRSCSIIVDSEHKTSTVVNGPGPLISDSEKAMFLDSIRDTLRAGDEKYVVLSGSLSKGMPDSTYQELVLMAKKYNKYVLLDASGTVLQEAITASPNLIKVNEEEFTVLTDSGQGVESTVRKYLHSIDTVVITSGSSGAMCYTGDRCYRVHPLGGDEPVNPTGCGDAFLGGYLSGLVRNYPVGKCLKLANAAAYANLLNLLPDIVNSLEKIEVFQANTKILETAFY